MRYAAAMGVFKHRVCAFALLVAVMSAGCDMCAALNGGRGLPCDNNQACPADQVCVGGTCVDLCRDDDDCQSGERCIELACRMPGRDAAVDAAIVDAAPAADRSPTDLRRTDQPFPDSWRPDQRRSDSSRHDGTSGDSAPLDSALPDQALPCQCADSADECSGGLCYRKDYVCNVVDICDDGYDCSTDNRCYCINRLVCGAHCTSDRSCAAGDECSADGICAPRIAACLGNAFCAADEWCHLSEGKCYPRSFGSATPGSQCQAHADCESALCVTRICLAGCSAYAGCESGQACQLFDMDYLGDHRAGCVAAAASECSSTCASYQLCDHSCGRPLCRRTADCGAGAHCAVNASGSPQYEPTTCANIDAGTCAGSELIVGRAPVRCSNATTCHLSLLDCGPIYTCTDPVPLGFDTTAFPETGICSLP